MPRITLDALVAQMSTMSVRKRRAVLKAHAHAAKINRPTFSRSSSRSSLGAQAARVFRGNQYVKVASSGFSRSRGRRRALRHK